MELTSAEEVHVVGLFPDAGARRAARPLRSAPSCPRPTPATTRSSASSRCSRPTACAVGSETAALALATPLDLTEAVELIHGDGGLAVAAHIDRKSFSVFSQLGFFPEDAGFDGLEVSALAARGFAAARRVRGLGLPLVGLVRQPLSGGDRARAAPSSARGAHVRRAGAGLRRAAGRAGIGREGSRRGGGSRCMTSLSICSRCSRTRCAPERPAWTSSWSSTRRPTSCA